MALQHFKTESKRRSFYTNKLALDKKLTEAKLGKRNVLFTHSLVFRFQMYAVSFLYSFTFLSTNVEYNLYFIISVKMTSLHCRGSELCSDRITLGIIVSGHCFFRQHVQFIAALGQFSQYSSHPNKQM